MLLKKMLVRLDGVQLALLCSPLWRQTCLQTTSGFVKTEPWHVSISNFKYRQERPRPLPTKRLLALIAASAGLEVATLKVSTALLLDFFERI